MKDNTLSTVLRTVLTPSAEYVGQELRNALRLKVEELKGHRQTENLRAHLAEVLEDIRRDAPPDAGSDPDPVRQLELFEAWCDGAQDVDPEDDELSQLWRRLLTRIAKGRVRSGLLINTLKHLDAFDAQLLLRFSRRGYLRKGTEVEEYHLSQMQRLNLIKETTERRFALLIPLLLATYMYLYYRIYAIAVGFSEATDIAAGFRFISKMIPEVGLAIALGALVGLPLFVWIPKWRLTWIGRDILQHAVPSSLRKTPESDAT